MTVTNGLNPADILDYGVLEQFTGRNASGARRSMGSFMGIVDDAIIHDPARCYRFAVSLLDYIFAHGVEYHATKQHAKEMTRLVQIWGRQNSNGRPPPKP